MVLGSGHVGLGLVRSLGRHGIPVVTLSDRYSLPGVSRYSQRCLSWPNGNQAQQADYLLALADRQRLSGWTLFPTSDESAAVIARHHAALGDRFVLTIPPWEIFRWAYDKRLTYQLAAQLGVDHPVTHYPASRAALADLECTFPAILKPAIKEGHNAFTSGKAWRVEDRRELLAEYERASALVPPETIMVQALIPSGTTAQLSFAALCLEGRTLASVVAQRTRQFPSDFGIGTFVETLDRPEIEAPARRMLAGMRHSGLMEMDFIRDERDGRYHLLDMNARPWSWHALGRRAGVDFPYLLWRLAHGERVRERRGRVGARWIHLVPDVQTALHQIRRGQMSVHHYLRSILGPMEGAVFALDDPLPGLIEVPLLLRQRWMHFREQD
jgi:predicted ATP-grasp superfamily ATP-dependent carboligase